MKSRLMTGVAMIRAVAARGAEAAPQHITVIVRDFAGIPDVTLRGAETEADRILGTAGVLIAWVEQPTYNTSRTPRPTELVVDILPAHVSRRNLDAGALGYAVPPESGTFGSYAGILYGRVQKINATGTSPFVVLGYAIAHELGHLLLGPGRHALSGVMKANWSHADLVLAAEGRFGFQHAERRRLRKNFLLRLEASGS
jgi:hypothetical protein